MMRLAVAHDAQVVASFGCGAAPVGAASIVMPLDEPGAIEAIVLDGNPLADDWLAEIDGPSERLVVWSGTLADGDDPFAAHPMNFMSPGLERLRAFCAEVEPALRANGKRLCFRPHARHVLSDAPGCLAFLRELADDAPFEVALDPVAMLEPAMLPRLEEHLERFFAALADRAPLLFLNDATIESRSVDGEQEERLVPASLGGGVIAREPVLAALRTWWPSDRPVVLAPGALDTQRAWLDATPA